jgi:hypothetical protein
MSTDDMVRTSSQVPQAAFNKTIKCAENNALQLNEEKTEMVVFRNGGKVAKKENTQIEKTELRSHHLTIPLESRFNFYETTRRNIPEDSHLRQ